MDAKDLITMIAAGWGATLSTIIFGWNLRRDLLDRSQLEVSASLQVPLYLSGEDTGKYVGLKYAKANGIPLNKLVVRVIIVNIARRPVYISGLEICNKPCKWWESEHGGIEVQHIKFILCQELPKTISESEKYSIILDPGDICLDTMRLYVYDSLHRRWDVGSKQMEQLKVDLKSLSEKEVADED